MKCLTVDRSVDSPCTQRRSRSVTAFLSSVLVAGKSGSTLTPFGGSCPSTYLAVAVAPGAAGVRVQEIMSRGLGATRGQPPPEDGRGFPWARRWYRAVSGFS